MLLVKLCVVILAESQIEFSTEAAPRVVKRIVPHR
jgi:hypothetical protein